MRQLAIALMLLVGLGGPVSAQDGTTSEQADAPAYIVRTTVEPETVAVGQPVVLRVTVLVPTWMPQPPVFPSMEAPNVIVRLPERGSGPVSENVEGETWSGVSRAYRLYPMVPGVVSLPTQVIGLTYADPETTQPIEVDAPVDAVSFTASVPDGAEGLDPMILASGLTLEQTLEGGEGVLAPGDAVTRTIVARIEGTSPLFLPPMIPVLQADPVQAYPKEPAVSESEDRGELSGQRQESVTYVAQYGGTVDLPEVALEWFNVAAGKLETATVPGITLEVDGPAPKAEPRLTSRQLAVLIGALCVLCGIIWALWRYVLPPIRSWQRRRQAAWLASEAHAAEMVQSALRARDLPKTHDAIARWKVVSGAASVDRLEAPLAGIGRARYGTTETLEDWGALDRAFDELRAAVLETDSPEVLPPLNPMPSTR
ncbi:oxygen tolerance protein BatD [Aliiruegeria haliotis]|uniref:Oxygen tolerance protein BatD n=1 Tax=Aliiruegeria haliotis TaxID=1280846 RepID=A0A2T0S073_9RHOB|nr:BatD family protein [Aliiruegeria haliotis]PRY26800.1 oxygen tolerance protein BatD [Aliiruegeria haliotis]